MVSEKIKNLKDRYKNGYDNIGKDLIGTCLKECTLYRRGTAYFSGSALMAWAEAISHVINDNVKIEIMCSPVVSDRHLVEILKNNATDEQRKKTIQKLADNIVLTAVGFEMNNERRDFRSQLLAYLIATKRLEFRFAIPKNYDFPEEKPDDRNLYHVKVGYFVFEDKSIVAFEGSVNESDSAHQYNTESAQVFKGWTTEDAKRTRDLVSDVDTDWDRGNPFIEVFDLSGEAIEIIKRLSPGERPRNPKLVNNPPPVVAPAPDKDGLRWYQKDALSAWKGNGFHGILEMATGTGKTKTAIAALKAFKTTFPSGLAVVTVPYQNLAEQWIGALESVGLEAMRVYENFSNWAPRLTNLLLEAQITKNNLPTIVVVERTFNSDKFQEILSLLQNALQKNHLVIADECHHFNREDVLELIPDFFTYRLGLSATPYDQFSKHHLDKYFGKIVFSFNLSDAIKNGFLTKYSYKFFPVRLNDEETIAYNELTQKIVSIAGGDEIFDPHIWPLVRPFLSQRSKIVAGCAEKLKVLVAQLSNQGPIPFTLFYCGTSNMDVDDGVSTLRQIEALTSVLHGLGWRTSRITADETLAIREKMIDMLRDQEIDAILSIKVLDEGIDIPSCRSAYLLASQASDRQGIQRRGRVLRLSEGKDSANLYDFLVIGGQQPSKSMSSLARRELRRAYNFAKDSTNFDELKPIIEDLAINSGVPMEDLYDKQN
jgi:superfamily II DNA or RNA helicase